MCTTKYRVILGLVSVIAGSPAIAASPPSFGEPVVFPLNGCPAKETIITRTDDKLALSVLRNQSVFVENLRGSKSLARSHCRIDFVFNEPLETRTTMQFDMRGVVFKGAQAETSYTLRLGSQSHEITNNRGEILDGVPLFRRFQLIDLPRGTAKVRLDLKGRARSLNEKDAANVSIDSFDLCFVDPAKPDGCGSSTPPPAPGK